VPKAEAVAPKVAEAVGLPQDTRQLVQLNAGVQVAAGVSLALGVFPRVSALALAGSLVPTTAAGHRFWEETEPGPRAQQRIHFLKNVAILGGLLYVVAG
jgi:putative oxidoreductase